MDERNSSMLTQSILTTDYLHSETKDIWIFECFSPPSLSSIKVYLVPKLSASSRFAYTFIRFNLFNLEASLKKRKRKKRHMAYPFPKLYPFFLTNLNCECAIDIFVPKVLISLRLLLFRNENHIQNPTFPFLFLFFHSETKDISCFIQKRKKYPIPQLYPSCLSK